MEVTHSAAWPACPECQQRRQTQCPVCHVADNQFPLGDNLLEAAPLQQPREPTELQEPPPELDWLICHCCDEPFQPTFYRYCQQCGHDFGEGTVVDVTPSIGDPLPPRAILVFGLLAGTVLALAAYFAWVLR